MKKYLFVFFIIIIVGVSLIYLLIPDTISVNKIAYSNIKSASAIRCLQDDNKWRHWFPGKLNEKDNLNYNNAQFHLLKKTYSSVVVAISEKNKTYISSINVIPANSDSSAIHWQLQFAASTNPFKRIAQYRSAKNLEHDIDVLLNSFKDFIQHTKNVYDFDITYTTLTDTALVSIKTITKEYPSTQLIYSLVDELKTYITKHNAMQHNYPMLNVEQISKNSYEVMVGIPTNVPLAGTERILPKRMMMIKNKTLVTVVIGNNNEIKKGLQATGNYMSDNELSAPVILFQQLVTDRRQQPDSTKWVTKIFSPIT